MEKAITIPIKLIDGHIVYYEPKYENDNIRENLLKEIQCNEFLSFEDCITKEQVIINTNQISCVRFEC